MALTPEEQQKADKAKRLAEEHIRNTVSGVTKAARSSLFDYNLTPAGSQGPQPYADETKPGGNTSTGATLPPSTGGVSSGPSQPSSNTTNTNLAAPQKVAPSDEFNQILAHKSAGPSGQIDEAKVTTAGPGYTYLNSNNYGTSGAINKQSPGYSWLNSISGANTIDLSKITGQGRPLGPEVKYKGAVAPTGSYELDNYGKVVTGGLAGPQFDATASARFASNVAGGYTTDFLKELMARATGTSTQASAAQAQLQQATDQALAAQQAQAAAARGQFNPAVARQLQVQSAQSLQQAANQSAQLRAQEQQAAATLAAQTGTALSQQEIGATLEGQKIATEAEAEAARQQNDYMKEVIRQKQGALIANRADEVKIKGLNAEQQAEFDKWKAGAEIDLNKFNTEQQNLILNRVIQEKGQAQREFEADLRASIKDDAQLRSVLDRFNSSLRAQETDNARQLLLSIQSGNIQAQQAWTNAKNNFYLELQRQGLSEDEIAQKWEIEKMKAAAAIEAARAGRPTAAEPSQLLTWLNILGTGLGVASSAVNLASKGTDKGQGGTVAPQAKESTPSTTSPNTYSGGSASSSQSIPKV